MKRRYILEIPLLLLLFAVSGAVCFCAAVVMLIPMLIWPGIIDGPKNWIGAQIRTQIVKGMMPKQPRVRSYML